MLDNTWRLVAATASCAFLVALVSAPRLAVAHASSPVPEPPGAPAATLPVTADLSVHANATYEARPDEPGIVYTADVIVNGVKAGRTPFAGGLVPGRYLIEVEGDGLRASTTIDVVGGKKYDISARFYVPMTEAEKRTQRDVELEAARAAKAEADARWSLVLSQWNEKDEAARAKRKPFAVSGAILLPVGLGLLIGGLAAEARAQDEHDKYLDHKAAWEDAIDPEEISSEKKEMAAAADARDANNGMGIAFITIGGAAIVTGIVVLAVMPKRPRKPIRALGEEAPPAWSVTPLVGPNLAGLGLDARF